MILDSVTIVSYPTQSVWAAYYDKFRNPLIFTLSRYGRSFADCEDAVEEAFHKLMHKKDPDAYGDRMPKTEEAWYGALYWQSRAYLSHLNDRRAIHARYVERSAKELEDVFACGHQGEFMDGDLRARALVRALETLKDEQDISRRSLEIYVRRRMGELSAKAVAKKYGITANNVDQIVWRIGRLVRKHGPRHFEAALRREGYGFAA